MTASEFLQSWQNHASRIEMDHDGLDAIWEQIPRSPGVYKIYTNTPVDALGRFGQRNDRAHYNLQTRINESTFIPDSGRIIQEDDGLYCVYNGHAAILRQRATEHFRGNRGSHGLAIFELNDLQNYEWYFEFLNLNLVEDYQDSKLYRTYLEQIHRALIGWPVLCRQ